MTTLASIDATCGICGARSQQTALGSTSSFGPVDLYTRPAEPARSSLPYWLGACPACGYVAEPALEAPGAGPARGAVAAALAGEAYRAQARERALPPDARRALCAALLAAAQEDEAAAGRLALWAAWACDDEGEAEAAAVCRERAASHWRSTRTAGERLLEDEPEICDALLLAETLRRAGRFDEALAEVDGAYPFDADEELRTLLFAVAELAWRGDAAGRTVDAAAEVAFDGDPTSRRVALYALAGQAWRATASIELVGRLELRRGERGGSAWVLLLDGRERPLSVWEAFCEAAVGGGRTPWDVLDATAFELEWWAGGGWKAAYDAAHPSPDAAVQALAAEWRLAWRRLHLAESSRERERLAARFLPERLAETALAGYAELELLVAEHGAHAPQQRTLELLLAHLLERPQGGILVLSAAAGYVQLLRYRERPALLLEAMDTEYQAGVELDAEQRRSLAALGWHDPKTEPVPYTPAHYAAYWSGGNFVQELPADAPVAAFVELVASTLARVYRLAPDDELVAKVIDTLG